MFNFNSPQEPKKIPAFPYCFSIYKDGRIVSDNKPVSLDIFNKTTNLNVKDCATLSSIVYQEFGWPPVYWQYLKSEYITNDLLSPENSVLIPTITVESKEYPGYYLIPGYSDYLITKDGLLFNKISKSLMQASKGILGYYTFRMKDDSGFTCNRLRHRILCLAFKPFPKNVHTLDVNHINGIPGFDDLDNLEWVTRSENINHALEIGLRKDNKPVQVREIATGKVEFFISCSSLGRALGVTETTISNRAATNGNKNIQGLQYRFYQVAPWPDVENDNGKYLVEFPDGNSKKCTSLEAARLSGLTRTSFLRMVREGREFGKTDNKITLIS